jgi:hypothetical protein
MCITIFRCIFTYKYNTSGLLVHVWSSYYNKKLSPPLPPPIYTCTRVDHKSKLNCKENRGLKVHTYMSHSLRKQAQRNPIEIIIKWQMKGFQFLRGLGITTYQINDRNCVDHSNIDLNFHTENVYYVLQWTTHEPQNYESLETTNRATVCRTTNTLYLTLQQDRYVPQSVKYLLHIT